MTSSNSLNHIMHDLNDGIVVFDSAGNIIEINPKAKQLLNLKNLETGLNLFSHISTNFQNAGELKTSLAQNEPVSFEIIRPETDAFNSLYLALKVLKASGSASEHIMVIRDESEKHMQSFLQNEFLTMISHKLRTPIVALSYAMNLVLKRRELQFSDKEADDFIEQSYFKSFEISEVVEKLIRFASVIKDKNFSKEEKTNLLDNVSEVIERYQKKFGKIRLPQTIELVKKAEDFSVRMPSEYVSILFECLLDNAYKFSNKENAVIKVTMGPSDKGKMQISIEDQGMGIPQEFLDKIFENFFQVDKYCAGTVEGVGLGLPLVRQILKTYDQSISVESVLGTGSKFTFTLPL